MTSKCSCKSVYNSKNRILILKWSCNYGSVDTELEGNPIFSLVDHLWLKDTATVHKNNLYK